MKKFYYLLIDPSQSNFNSLPLYFSSHFVNVGIASNLNADWKQIEDFDACVCVVMYK